jgi:hypothetical protein
VHEHLKRLNSVHQLSIRRVQSRKLVKLVKQSEKKLDKMKGKRETFDMHKAVKVLGKMIQSFEKLPTKPAPGEKHFKF